MTSPAAGHDAIQVADPDAGDERDAATAAASGALTGVWAGRVFEGRLQYEYTACISVTQLDNAGSLAGTSVYSDGYTCSGPGQLTLLAPAPGASGTSASFSEHFPNGGICAALDTGDGVAGRITLSLLPTGSVDWKWYPPSGASPYATGTLTETDACP